MQITLAGREVHVDVGHAVFASAVAGFCVWYYVDARAASSNLQNLMLIAPVSALVVVLYLVVLRECVTVGPAPPARHAKMTRQAGLRIFGSMALLAAYVGLLGFVGFDVATELYVLAELVLLGERRWTVLLLLPLGFTAVAVLAFSVVLANRLPLLIGSGP